MWPNYSFYNLNFVGAWGLLKITIVLCAFNTNEVHFGNFCGHKHCSLHSALYLCLPAMRVIDFKIAIAFFLFDASFLCPQILNRVFPSCHWSLMSFIPFWLVNSYYLRFLFIILFPRDNSQKCIPIPRFLFFLCFLFWSQRT